MICDTHIHFYDDDWPVASTTVLRPPGAGVADYRRVQDALDLERCVVVQPTTYGLDNSGQLTAMAELGSTARGVMVVDAATPDTELARLHELGVRGARFHMLPGGAVGWADLEPVAARIASLGWHIQLQLDGRTLPELVDRLRALPCDLVIDHVGRFMPPVQPDSRSFGSLLELVDRGRCWVKLSAPYESDPSEAPTFRSVGSLVDALVARVPDRLLWASNWPHPGQDAPPTNDELGALRDRWLPTSELRHRVLVVNPAAVYDF